MGLVFVLLPGGTFQMGAALPDDDQAPTEPNVDPLARENESPVHDVRLAPFFMSKYELTQGQWLRITGRNPSLWKAGRSGTTEPLTLRTPVETVSWSSCSLWLPRLGLSLPTEAQWEYATRAGSTAPWCTGIDRAGLSGVANLADEFCRTHSGPPEWTYEAWNDGHAVPASVGSFAPNSFGLHDVAGNVAELCRDQFASYRMPPAPGDGLRTSIVPTEIVFRGGGYGASAAGARSAWRFPNYPDSADPQLGLRPARVLHASPVKPDSR